MLFHTVQETEAACLNEQVRMVSGYSMVYKSVFMIEVWLENGKNKPYNLGSLTRTGSYFEITSYFIHSPTAVFDSQFGHLTKTACHLLYFIFLQHFPLFKGNSDSACSFCKNLHSNLDLPSTLLWPTVSHACSEPSEGSPKENYAALTRLDL